VADYASDELVFCLSDFFYGRAFSWLVTSLGTSPSRGSEILAFDLAIDPEELRVLSEEDLIAKFSVSPRVIRRIRANACLAKGLTGLAVGRGFPTEQHRIAAEGDQPVIDFRRVEPIEDFAVEFEIARGCY
jgi:hypothetical protein